VVTNHSLKVADHMAPQPQCSAWSSDQRPRYRVINIPLCHTQSPTIASTMRDDEAASGGMQSLARFKTSTLCHCRQTDTWSQTLDGCEQWRADVLCNARI